MSLEKQANARVDCISILFDDAATFFFFVFLSMSVFIASVFSLMMQPYDFLWDKLFLSYHIVMNM